MYGLDMGNTGKVILFVILDFIFLYFLLGFGSSDDGK